MFIKAVLTLAFWLLAAQVFAQLDSATVIGIVTDAQESVVPGATLTARNPATGFTRSTVTDAEGRYRLAALVPGSYELRSELQGFGTVIRNGVSLPAGSESIINFSMEPGGVTETIVVTAEVPIAETTSAAVAVTLTRSEIELLPNLGRNYVNLLRLAPTAALNNSSYGFGGSRSRSNQWFIDGLENSDDFSGFDRTNPAIDSIQEVQILVNGFKAEFGQSSGGVVNVITRSGTNTVRGGGFFMFRDHHLITRDPYMEQKDPFRRIQYGGTAGGPFRRDKIHYFVSYEREDRNAFDRVTQVLPSSNSAFATSTLQFLAENGIPLEIFGAGGRVAQARPEFIDHHKFSVRIDHQVHTAQTLTYKYTLDDDSRPSGVSGSLHDYSGKYASERQHYGAVTNKWVAAPNKLNETYVHFGRDAANQVAAFPGLTSLSVASAFDLGGFNPNQFTSYVTQVVDNLSWVVSNTQSGEHAFKVGTQVKLFRSDDSSDTNFQGTFTFPDLQAFIEGRPSRYTANTGDSRLNRPNNIIGLYAQDDWRPLPSLTLNLGLRYDYEGATNEALRDVNGDGSPGPGISRDINNVSPRFGLAWAPGGSTRQSFYGGTGVYYDQIILNVIGNARFTPPKIIGVQIDNPGWPDPLAGGTVRIPPPNVSIVDPQLVTPYNWNSQAGYRRELLTNLGLDVSFVYNRGYDQVAIINTNAGIPGTATVTGAGAARPDVNFTNKNLYTNYGRIWYKALVFDLRKRFHDSFQANVTYTLSKTTNNSFNFSSPLQVPSQPDLSIGPDAQDRRHRLEAHAEVMLPWDIQLATIGEFRSEAPIDVVAGGRDLNGDGITGDWPNERVCINIQCSGFSYRRNSARELRTSEANRLRALFGLAPVARFENNPKLLHIELTAQKRLRFGRHSGRVRIEVYNPFNIPQRLYSGSQNILSSLFGQYTAVDQRRAVQLTFGYDF